MRAPGLPLATAGPSLGSSPPPVPAALTAAFARHAPPQLCCVPGTSSCAALAQPWPGSWDNAWNQNLVTPDSAQVSFRELLVLVCSVLAHVLSLAAPLCCPHQPHVFLHPLVCVPPLCHAPDPSLAPRNAAAHGQRASSSNELGAVPLGQLSLACWACLRLPELPRRAASSCWRRYRPRLLLCVSRSPEG